MIENGFRLSTHYVNYDYYDVVVEVTCAKDKEDIIPNDLTLFYISINARGKTLEGAFNRSEVYPKIFEQIRKEIGPPSASLVEFFIKVFNPSVIGTTRGAYGDVLFPPAELFRIPEWASRAATIAMDALTCNWACTTTFGTLNAILVLEE